jgi:hypothetical protein
VLLLGFVAGGLASLALGQDNNWDLQNYHAYNAFAFLHDRLTFDVAPAQRQSYLNPIADVPFYLGSAHLPPRLFGFLMGGIHGLTCGLVFWVSFVVFRKFRPNPRVALSVLCTGLGVYGPVFVGELGGSANDILVSMLVFTVMIGRQIDIVPTEIHILVEGRSGNMPINTHVTPCHPE